MPYDEHDARIEVFMDILLSEYSEITHRTRTLQHTQIHGDCQPQTHHVHGMKILNIN
jgi:hypothetical protein